MLSSQGTRKQGDFCISTQAFLSPCEDRAANVSCGSFGNSWPASSAIPTASLRNPAELQGLGASGRWHSQLN